MSIYKKTIKWYDGWISKEETDVILPSFPTAPLEPTEVESVAIYGNSQIRGVSNATESELCTLLEENLNGNMRPDSRPRSSKHVYQVYKENLLQISSGMAVYGNGKYYGS